MKINDCIKLKNQTSYNNNYCTMVNYYYSLSELDFWMDLYFIYQRKKSARSSRYDCYSIYFSTSQSQPRIHPINQSQSTSCSPLIGPFKFQALSLVNTQKRTSCFHSHWSIKNRFRFPFDQSQSNRNHRCQVTAPNKPTSPSSSTPLANPDLTRPPPLTTGRDWGRCWVDARLDGYDDLVTTTS